MILPHDETTTCWDHLQWNYHSMKLPTMRFHTMKLPTLEYRLWKFTPEFFTLGNPTVQLEGEHFRKICQCRLGYGWNHDSIPKFGKLNDRFFIYSTVSYLLAISYSNLFTKKCYFNFTTSQASRPAPLSISFTLPINGVLDVSNDFRQTFFFRHAKFLGLIFFSLKVKTLFVLEIYIFLLKIIWNVEKTNFRGGHQNLEGGGPVRR